MFEQVFRGGLRPPLDKRWPEGLSTLMECCWQAEADMRPDAGEVVEMMAAIIRVVDFSGKGAYAKL